MHCSTWTLTPNSTPLLQSCVRNPAPTIKTISEGCWACAGDRMPCCWACCHGDVTVLLTAGGHVTKINNCCCYRMTSQSRAMWRHGVTCNATCFLVAYWTTCFLSSVCLCVCLSVCVCLCVCVCHWLSSVSLNVYVTRQRFLQWRCQSTNHLLASLTRDCRSWHRRSFIVVFICKLPLIMFTHHRSLTYYLVVLSFFVKFKSAPWINMDCCRVVSWRSKLRHDMQVATQLRHVDTYRHASTYTADASDTSDLRQQCTLHCRQPGSKAVVPCQNKIISKNFSRWNSLK